MWIVKIGGSLYGDPLLPQWLDMLVQLGGGRVVVVPGGGPFADEVRRQQGHWRFADLPAHNMAVLAMAQGAYLLQALSPALRLAAGDEAIHHRLHQGDVAVWAPYELLREQRDASTHWGVTSDSIALALARRLNAERLVLVKSCAVDPALDLQALVHAGVLDDAFAHGASGAGCAIDVVQRDQLAAVRHGLLHGPKAAAADRAATAMRTLG